MNKRIIKLAIVFLCLMKSMTAAIGIEFGSAQLQGHVSEKKSTIEDHIVTEKSGTQGFFAVFDGHSGDSVSNYAAENLLRFLKKNIKKENIKNNDDLASEIRRNIVNFDIHMFNDVCKSRNLVGGTTACVVYIPENSDAVFCANLGDSRAVLFTDDGTGNQPLSHDHNVVHYLDTLSDRYEIDETEKNRVAAAGGTVNVHHKIVGYMELSTTEKKYFFASTSRALGDFLPGWKHANLLNSKYVKPGTSLEDFSNHPISNVPDVSAVSVTPHHKFIVIASDGLWNVMKNEEVGVFVATCLRDSAFSGSDALTQIAKTLVEKAKDQWCQLYSTVSCDDISVIIIKITMKNASNLLNMSPKFLPSYESKKPYSPMQKVVIGGGAGAVAAGGVWGGWKIVNWWKNWKKNKNKKDK